MSLETRKGNSMNGFQLYNWLRKQLKAEGVDYNRTDDLATLKRRATNAGIEYKSRESKSTSSRTSRTRKAKSSDCSQCMRYLRRKRKGF